MPNDHPRNIFIIGAQCTGKTTLVRALQMFFAEKLDGSAKGPEIISEVARVALKDLSITREDIVASPERCLELQEGILSAQFDAENNLLDRGLWYISDRSGLDPLVYTRLFVGEAAVLNLTRSPHWLALEQNMLDGFVFLCEAGCDWLVDDGTRLMPKDAEEWEQVDHVFRGLLEERRIDYTLIPKNLALADRVALVIKRRT